MRKGTRLALATLPILSTVLLYQNFTGVNREELESKAREFRPTDNDLFKKISLSEQGIIISEEIFYHQFVPSAIESIKEKKAELLVKENGNQSAPVEKLVPQTVVGIPPEYRHYCSGNNIKQIGQAVCEERAYVAMVPKKFKTYFAGEYPLAPIYRHEFDPSSGSGVTLNKQIDFYPNPMMPEFKTAQRIFVHYTDKKNMKTLQFEVLKKIHQPPLRINKDMLGTKKRYDSSSHFLGQQTLAIGNDKGNLSLKICSYHPGMTITIPRTDGSYTYYFDANKVVSDVSASADFNLTLGTFSIDGLSLCAKALVKVKTNGEIALVLDEVRPLIHNPRFSGFDFQLEDTIGPAGDMILNLVTSGFWWAIEKKLYEVINSEIDSAISEKMTELNRELKSKINQKLRSSVQNGILQNGYLEGESKRIASVSLNKVVKDMNNRLNVLSRKELNSNRGAFNKLKALMCRMVSTEALASQQVDQNDLPVIEENCLESLSQVALVLHPLDLDAESRELGCYGKEILIGDKSQWRDISPRLKESCKFSLKIELKAKNKFQKDLLSMIESGHLQEVLTIEDQEKIRLKINELLTTYPGIVQELKLPN